MLYYINNMFTLRSPVFNIKSYNSFLLQFFIVYYFYLFWGNVFPSLVIYSNTGTYWILNYRQLKDIKVFNIGDFSISQKNLHLYIYNFLDIFLTIQGVPEFFFE